MELSQDIKKYLKETDNIFDLVGNCFGALCDNIDNHQLFVSQYIDGRMDNDCEVIQNPNLEKLNEFSEKIMQIMESYVPSNYDDVLKDILKCVESFDLIDFLDNRENELTIIYSILSAIDACAVGWEKRWMSQTLGPLDQHGKTDYRVYFNMYGTLSDDFVNQIGRKRESASTFFEQFDSFRFINSGYWKSQIDVPQIKYLAKRQGKHDASGIDANDLKIKIAVLPVSCEANFKFVPTIGSGRRIDYSEMDQEQVKKAILASLDKAISAKSDIIVLPEYVISPQIHEAIQSRLRMHAVNASKEDKSFLVFEGSSWTEDDNNVMKILDAWGEPIGEYYKYSPYTKKSEDGRNVFEWHEVLKNPGKCCDLIAVEGIGLLLPAICRDVIDGEYTAELMKMYFPTFAIIAAWSSSVATFEEKEKDFANKYFVSSVFANACAAVDRGKKKIANGCIVYKKGTLAGGKISDISRCDCAGSCVGNACVYLLEYDFAFGDGINCKINQQRL